MDNSYNYIKNAKSSEKIDKNKPTFNRKNICDNYSIKLLTIIKFFTLFLLAQLIYLFSFLIIMKRKKNIFSSNNKNENKDILDNNYAIKDNIFFDKYQTKIYNKIKEKIEVNKCSQMSNNQREFLNGVIRKYKPQKIVEIGVAEGGSSSVILNAIQDINNAHLYSIDLSDDISIGKCVKNLFPNFLNKWTLFTGDVAAKFMEEIGNNIDMVLIDSAHYEPGEILDFLIVLPFLKERAIVCFHDIANQITNSGNTRNEWAPYIIFNLIRGKPFFPSGNIRLTHDIGIKILDRNQNYYWHDYFRALGGQWQYFPKEKYIQFIMEYFKKYYDNDCITIFNETVEFNRKFVKISPMNQIYRYNSD